MFGLYQRNIASMKCILKPFSESETNWAQNIKQKQHLNENFNRTQAKNRWSNICIYVFKWIRFEYIMLYCWIGGRVYNMLPFVNKTSTIPQYFRFFFEDTVSDYADSMKNFQNGVKWSIYVYVFYWLYGSYHRYTLGYTSIYV